MNDDVNAANEQLKAGYRKKTRRYVRGCYALLFIAVISPILAPLDPRPAFESAEVWFQRSGALTTIFALLTTQLRDMGTRSLHNPGMWGDALKLEVLSEFERKFDWIFWIAFGLTVVGTIIWGYGDTIYKIAMFGQ